MECYEILCISLKEGPKTHNLSQSALIVFRVASETGLTTAARQSTAREVFVEEPRGTDVYFGGLPADFDELCLRGARGTGSRTPQDGRVPSGAVGRSHSW